MKTLFLFLGTCTVTSVMAWSSSCSFDQTFTNTHLYSTLDAGSGDVLRKSNGIRPSLHPMAINALSDALLAKSRGESVFESEPVEVALYAGKLAADVIAKKERALSELRDVNLSGRVLDGAVDENKWELPTMLEKQVVSGRILGVVMRLEELEKNLVKKVKDAKWPMKYGAMDSFGVLKCEVETCDLSEENERESGGDVNDRVKIDPLFRMSRAECLLAIFMNEIERPQIEQSSDIVLPDEGKIDFIDADRLEVLVSD
mmetsp:Transcript_12860/g.16798  ORF Transcript_12860/g.16798 Transcript_12860/m.16798 type:complete len:258 (-) Transcript_12860:339-1112(-)